MEEKIAIAVCQLKKQYRLGRIGGQTLQEELQSWWAKKRGRENPNLPIGMDERCIGQRFWALNGIDLTIRQGERVGIIGNNGAGKSTLLKLLSRITAPTEGDIYLRGRISSMLEVGTGFHGEMTGRENIYMNGAILGMSRAEIDAKLEQIIRFSEVGEFIDTPVKRYSSGMFVKLAFAVAAHLDSEILIMDEVLAVGDMAFQKKCLEKMREAADKEGRTILYVSHNMTTIRQLCERCIVLHRGKVIFDGEVEEAIAVYMNHALGENEVDIDLQGKSVIKEDTGLSMRHLTLLRKVVPVYQREEDLTLRLTVQVERPLEALRFRLTLRTDGDVGLGTAWSAPFDLGETGEQQLFLTLPLRGIAKGQFYASIGIYREDEIGQPTALDHITRAFRLEVEGLPIWSTSAHGYVQLPELMVAQ